MNFQNKCWCPWKSERHILPLQGDGTQWAFKVKLDKDSSLVTDQHKQRTSFFVKEFLFGHRMPLSQRLFGIFAHAAHCGQGTSRSMGYVKPKASHTSRLPYLSASGLAKDNYPKLQPEIPQLTLRQIPENMENGCAAQLKQLAKRNIVQVKKQYRYIQWATCTLGEILFWQWSG